MNEILKKATEELAKESPDIAYVRGMLETLLAMNGTVEIKASLTTAPSPVIATVSTPTDEGAILDAQTRALLGKIPPPTE